MKTAPKTDFLTARPHAKLTTGEVIKMLRDLKGWTQQELAKRSGITSTNLSLLENNKITIGKRRSEQLAKAFEVHPAIIMFPEFETREIDRLSLIRAT